jgi:predicted AAA+ superfamily ATPase
VFKAIIMSVNEEISEIIRRRLFDWGGMPDDARRVARAYADWAVEHAPELSGITAETAYEQFEAAYPFHPSVLSVFQRKWQSLPRFQRTRGVLRMLALFVGRMKGRPPNGQNLVAAMLGGISTIGRSQARQTNGFLLTWTKCESCNCFPTHRSTEIGRI